MSSPRRLAVLLLCAGCASGGAPAPHPAAPAPAPPPATSTPSPGIDPARVEPARDLAVRYPRSGGGIARYAFARHDSIIATMPAGDQQVQILGRTAFVTITWVANDTGARVTAVVDSVVPDSGLLNTLPMVDSARGSRWTGFRRLSGQVVDLAGGPHSLVGDQVRDQLRLLFPLLPPDGARPGASWSDSTSAPGRVSAFEATETARVTSRAERLVTSSGALPLIVIRSRSAVGEGTQFGQPMNLKASGSDSLAYQIAPDGRVLGVEGVRLTELVVDLPSIGQSVPARERSLLRMTLLP